jgi:hypothetical protein
MSTTIDDRPVEVETFVWMKVVKDLHTGKKYYSIGQVKDVPNTLLVTLCSGNGGAVFYCQTHQEAFPFRGSCASCRNEVVDVAIDASATTCSTPEIEQVSAGR